MGLFPVPVGVPCISPLAPTGEPFIVLQGGGYESREEAEAGAKVAFDTYAEGRTGTTYWRIAPEVSPFMRKHYRFYMRLLISDKERM